MNQDGNAFLCRGHGARFSASGMWIGGERTSSLRSYPTTYDVAADTIKGRLRPTEPTGGL